MSTGKAHTCFWDACELLRPLRERGLSVRYVEGWAVLNDGAVLQHGWLKCDDGVIDDSDQHGRRVIGYFGAYETDDPAETMHTRDIELPFCRDHLCKEGGERFDANVAARYRAAEQRARLLSKIVMSRA